MTSTFPVVRLGSFLTHRKEFFPLDDTARYKRVRVQLHNKGIVLRDIVEGAELRTKKQQAARSGDLLVAEIDAKVGGFGIVPPELDGAIVSSHYFLYEIDETKCLRGWLDAFIRSGGLEDQVKARGTTNYAAIRPEHVFAFEIPLPPADEQRRLVARIEELVAKIDEARGLRKETPEEVASILRATVSRIDAALQPSHELVPLEYLASSEKGAIRSGPFGSSLLHNEFVEEGVPAIGIEDVQENRFVLTRRWHVTPEKAGELDRFCIKPGDVLITVMGTLGRTCVVPEDAPHMISTKHVWTVTLDPDRALGSWVSYWVNFSIHVRTELLGKTTGTAIGGLNGQKIRAVNLPLISLQEQQRIVSYLNHLQAKLDQLRSLQAETAAELDALLPSTLDKAFRGELLAVDGHTTRS